MQNITCPECGATVDGNAEVCPECGFKLNNENGGKKEEVAETKKQNLLLEVPYRYNFNKGWKCAVDWFLSFGWLIAMALIIAGVIVLIVAGAKPANDPLEILQKAVNIKDSRDTVVILLTVGLTVFLIMMLGEAAKDVYIRIFYDKWLSKRKEQAVETVLMYDAATATVKENDFIEPFANATYHAHNPKENTITAIMFFVYMAICLLALISTILLARDVTDIIVVKLISDLSGKEFNVYENLPIVLIIVCAVAWLIYILVKKLCPKSYYKRYAVWAKEKGIL